MTTYTIVSKDADPLGPNEIRAGDPIEVSEGDTFIVDPSADANITFESADGTPTEFNIDFSGSNENDFTVKVEDNLTPSVAIDDGANLADIDFHAESADGVTFDAGDNVSFGKFDGSKAGSNDIVIGNGFSTDKNWKFGDADDTLIVGDDATFQDIDTGDGNDTVTFGDRATVKNVDTKEGDDDVRFGDDLDANDVKTGKGDDDVYFGQNAHAKDVDGGEGNDTFRTESSGQGEKNFESSQVVCYAPETLIETPSGPRRVYELRPGDLVLTLDRGPQPIVWVRADQRSLDGMSDDARPILISAHALGPELPKHDLIVSPQHRILVGGHSQLEHLFLEECFIPAKAMTGLPGIRVMRGKQSITWVHFACRQHHGIKANGLLSESLYLGPMVLRSMPVPTRQYLERLFGMTSTKSPALNGPPARPFLGANSARKLLNPARYRQQSIKCKAA